MTVSIMIANYNYGRYLGEAIESALAQTHQPIEILVVDDGSSDDSVAVAKRYPVRVIECAHEGVAPARNRGALEARGEHIVFLGRPDSGRSWFMIQRYSGSPQVCLRSVRRATQAWLAPLDAMTAWAFGLISSAPAVDSSANRRAKSSAAWRGPGPRSRTGRSSTPGKSSRASPPSARSRRNTAGRWC